VFQRRQHVINLFMWPAQPEVNDSETGTGRQGDHLAHWHASGMHHWEVSNPNQAELREFVRATRQ
jgi:hypothetical protein